MGRNKSTAKGGGHMIGPLRTPLGFTPNTGKLVLRPDVSINTIPRSAPQSAPIMSPAQNDIHKGTKKK